MTRLSTFINCHYPKFEEDIKRLVGDDSLEIMIVVVSKDTTGSVGNITNTRMREILSAFFDEDADHYYSGPPGLPS